MSLRFVQNRFELPPPPAHVRREEKSSFLHDPTTSLHRSADLSAPSPPADEERENPSPVCGDCYVTTQCTCISSPPPPTLPIAHDTFPCRFLLFPPHPYSFREKQDSPCWCSTKEYAPVIATKRSTRKTTFEISPSTDRMPHNASSLIPSFGNEEKPHSETPRCYVGNPARYVINRRTLSLCLFHRASNFPYPQSLSDSQLMRQLSFLQPVL
ncbi:hypothetical protein TNCV_3135951 [Trichonephila clavipes]|nr:hypothetical protein TNCV_3135951 [Trichonephila clavipes]